NSGTAFLGSGDGNVYAIRTSDGTVLWTAAIGVPVLGSAALSTDGTAIFVVAENAVAYALATGTGAILWQTQLQGQSASDRWPVVLGNSVYIRTQPISNFSDLLHTGDTTLDLAGPELSDWTQDWNLIEPSIVSYLVSNPGAQTFFALSASNGQSLGT